MLAYKIREYNFDQNNYPKLPTLEEFRRELFSSYELEMFRKNEYIVIDKETAKELELTEENALKNYEMFNLFDNGVIYDNNEINVEFIKKECLVFHLRYIQDLKIPELASLIAYGDNFNLFILANLSNN